MSAMDADQDSQSLVDDDFVAGMDDCTDSNPRMATVAEKVLARMQSRDSICSDDVIEAMASGYPAGSVTNEKTEQGSDNTVPRRVSFTTQGGGVRNSRSGSIDTATYTMSNGEGVLSRSLASKTSRLSERELKRRVLCCPRDNKRLLSALQGTMLSRRAYLNSFTIGVAIGSITALLLKVITDIVDRLVYR